MTRAHQTPAPRHLLGIEGLSTADIETFLKLAGEYSEAGHRTEFDCSFRKLVCANLFLEPSTRTKMSFELACHRLGIKPLNFDAPGSSLKKDESLLDTFLAVAAMKPDLMVIRQGEAGFLQKVAKQAGMPLINAGDGAGEHPTQALLDALTMIEAKGGLKGLKVAICGDIAHSRVARSNFHLLTRMGARVSAFGPPEMVPDSLPEGVVKSPSFEEALAGSDVVMMLRVQIERMKNPPPLGKYLISFGLTRERLKLAHKNAIVMHPGPINRGVEIAPEVADDPKRSVILKQVANGVAVRMAVLDVLTRGLRS